MLTGVSIKRFSRRRLINCEDAKMREELTLKRSDLDLIDRPLARRKFIVWSGVAMGLTVSGCRSSRRGRRTGPGDLGEGDTAIFNLAYAISQTQAEFYNRVVEDPYPGAPEDEINILRDMRDQERIQRDFFRDIQGRDGIEDLEFNFDTVNFENRQSVLDTAHFMEDLGVSAFNGGARFLNNENNMNLLAKMASVEARQAATIRTMLQPNTDSFAGPDVVDPQTGLDIGRSPDEVVSLISPFIETEIDSTDIPRD